MKQPELGKKILELRKQKGFTQEELVEQCNINVRTIQRIESGEVSPRSYTIKAILEVLGFNYDEIFEEKYQTGKFDKLLGINPNNLKSQLNIALIAGVIYFILGFGEVALEFMDVTNYEFSMLQKFTYISIKIIAVISFFLFFKGFVIIGGLFKNETLQLVSFLLIVIIALSSIFDITLLFVLQEIEGVIGFSQLITFGILVLFFGISIFKMKKEYGDFASIFGIAEMIAGFCFLTIILAPVGLFLLVITEILEMLFIYKTISKLK